MRQQINTVYKDKSFSLHHKCHRVCRPQATHKGNTLIYSFLLPDKLSFIFPDLGMYALELACLMRNPIKRTKYIQTYITMIAL